MASDDNLLNDDEIQKLLDAAGGDSLPSADDAQNTEESTAPEVSGTPSGTPAATTAQPAGTATASPPVAANADELLSQVEAGLSAALSDSNSTGNVVGGVDGAVPFELSDFGDSTSDRSGQRFSLGTLDDVELDLQIELGRAELLIEEVLALREGAVVPLDKLAGDPVDILVNGRLLARGEVLVLNDNFCVRVAEIVSPDF